MSLFTDASMVLVPSGIKNQKIYSVKPTDGSGDLTFSRASNATRVNSSGLVEKVRTNEVIQSENFSTWTLRPSSSVTSNTIANPLDGAITADTINQGTNIYSGVYNSASASSNYWTNSVYLKAGTLNYAFLLMNGSASNYAWFNLSTGSVSGVTSNELASITDAGGGWYRCAVYSKVLTSNGVIQFGFSDATVFTPSISGYGYAFGAQAEVSDFGPTPYIKTESTAVSVGATSGTPRLDYSGGASCPSLLLEPQRTNIATWSELFSAWSGSITLTSNDAISPDGYQNADLLTSAGPTDTKYRNFSGNAQCTISIFAKQVDSDYFLLSFGSPTSYRAIFRFSDGVCTSASTGITATTSENYGNGWWRFSATTPSSSNGYIEMCPNTSATTYYSGGSCLAWGAQYEDLATYPSSYIPTQGLAVTRVLDAANKTSASAIIGQTEGTIFVEAKARKSGRFALLGSGTNFMEIIFTASGRINAFVYNGSTQVNFDSSSTYSDGDTLKVAFAYKANDFVLYVNGVQEGTDTSGAVPSSMSVFRLNSYLVSGYEQAQNFKQALLFTTRLSNADLATLTA